MALVDLDEVKNMLGVTTSVRDTQYAALIPAAEDVAKRWARNRFERETFTEYLTGNGMQEILLTRRPVSSVTSVWEASQARYGSGPGEFDNDTLLVAGTDYSLKRDRRIVHVGESGILVRHNTVWPMFRSVARFGVLSAEPGWDYGNIKVVYVAGYDPIPEDVKWAVAQIIEWFRIRALSLGIESERIGDYAVKYRMAHVDSSIELGTARQILSQYRDPVL